MLFRALGIESDKDILEHIFYNLEQDGIRDMLELLKPSLAEALEKNTQEEALDYIGGRCNPDQ